LFAATTIRPMPLPPVGASTVAPRSLPASRAGAASAPAYPADVIRILNGDTFEARARVWPGLDITTKVRLRGIDAPEMRARCA
jgi:endonuclease YncB( thermonuclease family)